MKITKTTERKYPLKVTMDNGTVLKVPNQARFDNAFLRSHGCSLMAEYLALQYIGIHVYPLHLLQWHKKHDSEDIKAKVTLKGVTKGIVSHGGVVEYSAVVTEARIRSALRRGHTVIMEEKNPIHSIFLFHEDGKNYIINYGKVKRADVKALASRATTNATYRGMVVTKRKVKS